MVTIKQRTVVVYIILVLLFTLKKLNIQLVLDFSDALILYMQLIHPT